MYPRGGAVYPLENVGKETYLSGRCRPARLVTSRLRHHEYAALLKVTLSTILEPKQVLKPRQWDGNQFARVALVISLFDSRNKARLYPSPSFLLEQSSCSKTVVLQRTDEPADQTRNT